MTDGVWYVTGGTHHSTVIEMNDHLVVVEAPLNDERALAVLAEARGLSPKPIKFVVNSHHHFDHAGGLRAVAGEGITILTHEVNRPFFARTLATPATVTPDHLTKSGKKGTVEGVRDRQVLSDGTRQVEIHHIAGNTHHDGAMVYLPKERAHQATPSPRECDEQPQTPPHPFASTSRKNLAARPQRRPAAAADGGSSRWRTHRRSADETSHSRSARLRRADSERWGGGGNAGPPHDDR